jgi:hypothetical protein
MNIAEFLPLFTDFPGDRMQVPDVEYRQQKSDGTASNQSCSELNQLQGRVIVLQACLDFEQQRTLIAI